MLKNYGKLLLEEQRGDELFCAVVACVENGKLQIAREDYGEWERNRRSGTVELDYYFDVDNTDKLCKLFGVKTSKQLIDAIAKKCESHSGFIYTHNITHLCDENGIKYDFRVWY